MKKVAVILSGCGYLDGAEIRESVGALLALDELGCEVQCFAPSQDQHHVVNTISGEEMKEKRNIMIEASRIARGKIKPLLDYKVTEFDALVIPGGFGVAKNLCTFAFDGSSGKVLNSVQLALEETYENKKPIAAICIAPALLALCFKDKGFEMTLGQNGEASQELEKLGHKHIEKKANEYHLDQTHKIATTPAYMYDDGKLSHIYQGIKGCITATVELG